MKRWVHVLIFSGWVLVIMVVFAIFRAGERPLRPVKVATGDWEPFVGSDLSDQGPIATVVKEAFHRIRYEPTFSFDEWKLVEEKCIQNGDVFAAFPFIDAIERRPLFYWSDPLFSFDYVMFYKLAELDPQQITGDADLSGYKIGLGEGYQLWGDPPEGVKVYKKYKNVAAAFIALDKGEIDLLAESLIVGEHTLHSPNLRLDASQFSYLKVEKGWLSERKRDLRLITRKTREAELFLAEFNKALAEVKATRIYKKMKQTLDRYQFPKTPDVVRLSSSPVIAKDSDGAHWFLLPRGTRASLLEWAGPFHKGFTVQPDPAGDHWCRLKILNGPLRGRILQVEADKIELEH